MTASINKKVDELIERALGLDPASSEEEFVKCLREAIELNPYNFRPHILLGNFYYKQERLEEAAACFMDAINIDYTFKNDPNEAAKVYLNLGKIYQTLGDKPKSLVYYKDYIGLFPSASHAEKLASQIYVKLKNFKDWFESYKNAREYLAAGRNKEAEKLLKSCIKNNPSFAWPSFYLAVSYMERNMTASVADILKKSIKHRSHYCFKYELYRFQLKSGGSVDEKLLDDVRTSAPNFVPAIILDAKRMKKNEEFEKAAETCKKIISSLPGTEYAQEALDCLFDMPADQTGDDKAEKAEEQRIDDAASEEAARTPEEEPEEKAGEEKKTGGLMRPSASPESKAEAKGGLKLKGGISARPAKVKQRKGLLHKTGTASRDEAEESVSEAVDEAASEPQTEQIAAGEEQRDFIDPVEGEMFRSAFDSQYDDSEYTGEEYMEPVQTGFAEQAVEEPQVLAEEKDEEKAVEEPQGLTEEEHEDEAAEKPEEKAVEEPAAVEVREESVEKPEAEEKDEEIRKPESRGDSDIDSASKDADSIIDEAFTEAERITEEAYAEAETIKKAARDEADDIRKQAENSLAEEKERLAEERRAFEEERESMRKEIEEMRLKTESECEEIRQKAKEEAEEAKRESQVSAQILRKKIEIEERYEELLLKLNRERKALRLQSLDDAEKIIRAAEKKRDEIIARAERVAEKIEKVSKQADDDYSAVYKNAIDESYHMIAEIRVNAEKEGKHIIELAEDEKTEVLQGANDKAYELLNKGLDMTFDATDDSLNRMVMDYGSIADATRQKLDEFCSEMQESFEKMFSQSVVEIKNKFISSLDNAIEENGEEMRKFAESLKKELSSTDVSGIFSEAEGLRRPPVNLLKDTKSEEELTDKLSAKLNGGHGRSFPDTSDLTDGIYPENDTNPLAEFAPPSEEEEAAEIRDKVSKFVGDAFDGISDEDIEAPEEDIIVEDDDADIDAPELDDETEDSEPAEAGGETAAEAESADESADEVEVDEESDVDLTDMDDEPEKGFGSLLSKFMDDEDDDE